VTAADDLHAYAVAATALALVSGTSAFAGPMPPQHPVDAAPASVAFVVYGAGRPSEQAYGAAGVKWEWPRVQVLVRGCREDLASAETLAEALYDLIGGIAPGATVNGTVHLAVTCLQPPTFLRWDADRRPEVVFNVECHREVS
jgi:hypothetical protein